MDPIKNGNEIFLNVAKSFSFEQTNDISEAKKFLDLLLKETKGLVIVDFLDAGNWDRLDGVFVDEENKLLFLNWHDYRGKKESEHEKEMRQIVFPANLYSCYLHFNELRIVKTKLFPLILFRGYAIKEKEIKKHLQLSNTEYEIEKKGNNFSTRIIRKKNEEWEIYDCLDTPIFSLIIIPKNIRFSSTDSKKILFSYNLYDALVRFERIEKEIKRIQEEDKDKICEMANTARRIFEYVLKVECCYRYRQFELKKDYSDLMLGDLIKLIKEFREEPIYELLKMITLQSNELSHDTGKPITLDKAKNMIRLAIIYTKLLESEINKKPHPEQQDSAIKSKIVDP